VVLSCREFNIGTGLAAVCPVTNTRTGSSFEVPIPRGALLTGVVLSSQFRTVDWLARNASFHSRANEQLMWDVLGRIEAILSVHLS
jgi:mRNA interferase MazF